jgi:TolB-like protein
MADPAKFVFLSYASQDSAAAQRICDDLRAAGLEVWFDVSGGLEHGDEWDVKIRRRIKECLLFVPVISASTQARHEGYFRLEWELAAERAMTFASTVPFLLPVVIDHTGEAEALVPERFRRVQWTRLPSGALTPEIQARFRKLWDERTGVARAQIATVPSPLAVPGRPGPEAGSIAVLPFANLSADPDNEYFSDGITEEIINALVQVPTLRVAARTSVFAFKGRSEDLREIAAKLGVRTVLEGSVRKAAKRLRITAQLVNAQDGFHLWSDRFDRDLDDIFAVQDEIARTIADTLAAKLASEPQRALVKAATGDIEAYELYLRGRFFWAQRGAGLRKGLEYFQQAIGRDPNFAAAHAGVADSYSLLAMYGYVRARDVMLQARAAAERALALDPDMAEAHTALAYVTFFSDRDPAAALAGYERSMRLKPSLVTAYTWAASAVGALQSHAACVPFAQKAAQLEPLSLAAQVVYAWTLIFSGQMDRAVERATRAVELQPASFLPYWVLGPALIGAGRREEGVSALRRCAELSGQLPWMLAALGCGLAFVGQTDEARQLLATLLRRAATEYVCSYPVAMLQAHLSDEAAALTWLDRAIEDGDLGLSFLYYAEPHLAPMGIPAQHLSPANRAAVMTRMGFRSRQPGYAEGAAATAGEA